MSLSFFRLACNGPRLCDGPEKNPPNYLALLNVQT
jgi:hypothetical protein